MKCKARIEKVNAGNRSYDHKFPSSYRFSRSILPSKWAKGGLGSDRAQIYENHKAFNMSCACKLLPIGIFPI